MTTNTLAGETPDGSWTAEREDGGFCVTLRSGPVSMTYDGQDREALVAGASRCGNERVRGSMVRLAKVLASAVGAE